ncbi:MAG: cytochrome c oxidase subunit II [Deltaproteobacteria bacterium]|nr:cytochrome c oxidase subunit II [Deltaproteobacteria bacterium]
MLSQASTISTNVDKLYDFIFWTSFVSFVLIIVAMLYFVVKFHRRRKEETKTAYITGHGPLEFSVATILFVLVMVIFAWGWIDYRKIIYGPDPQLEIQLMGRQWMWEATYPNGRKLKNELVIPMGQNVRLTMTSADVIHSFYIPDFRIKQDVVPGSYTKLWFNAVAPGEYTAFCAEYCGFDHSRMLAKVQVLRPKAYDKWYKKWKSDVSTTSSDLDPLVSNGKKVFEQKGCNACHSVDGAKGVGPSFLHSFGEKTSFADGSSVTFDENYIQESLMEPSAKVVKGFTPVMPTFKGQLQTEDVNALISYIKSFGKSEIAKRAQQESAQPKVELTLEDMGEQVFVQKACNACHSIDGRESVGPSLLELYSSRRHLKDGSRVTADEVYITESIVAPNAKIVSGYLTDAMPSYETGLSEKELKALVEYIKGI